jgi:hypothetical protein
LAVDDTAQGTATPGSGIRFQQRAKASETGTLGAVLTDRQGGRYALSTNHVLARNGVPMRQPGYQVVGTGSPETPRFSHVPLGADVRFQPLFHGGQLDCAMVKADPPAALQQVFPPQLQNMSTEVVPAAIDRQVGKYGHATRWTTGKVAAIADVPLNFGPGLGALTISQAILVTGENATCRREPFARAGDSGSVVFQLEQGRWQPMGLLMGGPTNGPPDHPPGDYFAVCPLREALTALDLQLEPPLRNLRVADRD